MIININEEINKTVVDKISNSINQLKPAEKLFIYLCTEGGDTEAAEAIIHIINNNADIIEMVAYGKIFSAGFNIFFRSLCHKIILHSTVGMCHYSYIPININENGGPIDKAGKIDKIWLKSQRQHTIDFCKNIGMTDKEVAEVRKGGDVYFLFNRMQDFLKEQKTHINA